jgi:glutaredoxin-like YruB-family protein
MENNTQNKVVVYSTPTCPYCLMVKQYLNKQNIPFQDIDVSEDWEKAQEMMNKSGQQGVPQLDINGQMVLGFNIVKINQLLGL